MKKKPHMNPVAYIIFLFVLTFFTYYFFTTVIYTKIWQIILFSVIFVFIFLYLGIYVLRPYHPVIYDGKTITLKRFYARPIVIDLRDIIVIERYNRYDTLYIETKERKYRVSFLLGFDDTVREIQKKLKRIYR